MSERLDKGIGLLEELERFFLLYVQAKIHRAFLTPRSRCVLSLRCLHPSSGALQRRSSASTSTFCRFPNTALALTVSVTCYCFSRNKY